MFDRLHHLRERWWDPLLKGAGLLEQEAGLADAPPRGTMMRSTPVWYTACRASSIYRAVRQSVPPRPAVDDESKP
jgi:hypothetical protein